jgi:hypothetical protein
MQAVWFSTHSIVMTLATKSRVKKEGDFDSTTELLESGKQFCVHIAGLTTWALEFVRLKVFR